MQRLVIVDDVHPALTDALHGLPHVTVDYLPDLAPADVPHALHMATVLVVRSKVFVDAKLLQQAPLLRIVARAGAGTDNLDAPALATRNIHVINAPEGNRDAVAEHALGMMLALRHRLAPADAQVRRGQWLREANRGRELGGCTLGLIGYGNAGQALAAKASGLGMRLLAYDKYAPAASGSAATAASLAQLQAEADMLSLHIPLTPETRHLIDAAFLERLERRPLLVNTARGAILHTEAALNALERGALSGLALDVLENERLHTYTTEEQALFTRLTARPDVLLTPHIAGWSTESYRRISEVLAAKLLPLLVV